jgi:hypothetical protein
MSHRVHLLCDGGVLTLVCVCVCVCVCVLLLSICGIVVV